MATKNPARLASAAAVLATAIVIPTPAQADPLPYGPDTCIQGYVWREARTGDTVCVTPDIRATVKQQNANPGAKKDPNGAYGPQSCAQGFVWREAFDGDTICVTPDFRQQMFDDNAAAASRKAANAPKPTPQASQSTIVLEVTGAGEVYSIWSIPFNQVAGDHTKIPFSKSYPLPADEDYVSLTWTSRDDQQKGCRITVDGKVVVEKPVGTADTCVFTR
ncbi:hypothetical protein [Mycolicibacterium mageritense]|uniref:Secreted protein n=1 Tax=Mycolicibacterium mageritense TaxID=53462 RepID=A0AAI8U1L9_MYCME|nr:hypothetical protein [Mycolicibacterium mageritense]BDY32895.1 hypothetical protein hbim_06867 [Mycolicibacterium mageritense]